MGREKLDDSKKKIRIDVFIEKEKSDLLGKKHCSEISKERIEKEYIKQLKLNNYGKTN